MIECGRDVEFIKKGDICSVPFNIACWSCRNCKEGRTGICLKRTPRAPARPMATWTWAAGSVARRNMSWSPTPTLTSSNSPTRIRPREDQDVTLLSDIFPTGYHGAVTAGVGPGTIVYVAGAGPVGLACAASCHLLGAACVIVGD